MKLGLMTAAFPNLTLGEVAEWAAASGFGMLEIACWPVGKRDRRYGGVSHIDVANLDAARAKEINALLADRGLQISSLGYYPNPLHPDPAHREEVIGHLKKVIDAARLLGVEIVGSFVGADQVKSADQNLEGFARVWPPIVRYARERDVTIAIENCPMLWPDTWPGGSNVAYSPAIWRRMFEIVPDDNFGLNYDPSHLIWQFIDEVRPIAEFKDRIVHVHAKDLAIDRELLYQDGVLGCGFRWAIPRLPGLGEVRWDQVMAALYAIGYDHVVSIEHEDRAFEGTDDLVKRGFYLAREVLRPYIV
jgi:sugar phosphate isomerase/epimerase